MTPNDLSFLMQYILKFTFFSAELMFFFQLSLLSKKNPPKYLSVSTLTTACPLMKTGHLWFFLKSMHISFQLLLWKHSNTSNFYRTNSLSFQSACGIVHLHYYNFFPTSSISSANFTRGHDSSVLLQSAVYSAKKKKKRKRFCASSSRVWLPLILYFMGCLFLIVINFYVLS